LVHSIDRWDDATGSNLYEHLASVNDLLLAQATFEAALARRKAAKGLIPNLPACNRSAASC
jgi:hypothetical protein